MVEDVQVTVGQVWADDDPRKSGRRIEILEVDQAGRRARGRVVSVAYNVREGQRGNYTRWIGLDRFRPGNRGYRLIS